MIVATALPTADTITVADLAVAGYEVAGANPDRRIVRESRYWKIIQSCSETGTVLFLRHTTRDINPGHGANRKTDFEDASGIARDVRFTRPVVTCVQSIADRSHSALSRPAYFDVAPTDELERLADELESSIAD